MITALVSKSFVAGFGAELKSVAEQASKQVEFMIVPGERGARLSQPDCDRIDCAFMDREIRHTEQLFAAYGAALLASNSVKWTHVSSSGRFAP